jgi:Spy/CpxP family protein refolding chaperone
MQRSKHLALMFLLGATLVGGALGFTADRWYVRDHLAATCNAPRVSLYDQLQLNPAQRASMDSIIDDRHRKFDELFKPIRAQMDSIRSDARNQMRAVLNPQQRERFEAILADQQQRANDKRGSRK